jgi:hypothetical protein
MSATAAAKAKRPKVDTAVAELLAKIQKAKKTGKLGYERADRLTQELAKIVAPGEEVNLNEAGRKLILHDRFAEASQKGGAIWTPCAARRWELEIIEP